MKWSSLIIPLRYVLLFLIVIFSTSHFTCNNATVLLGRPKCRPEESSSLLRLKTSFSVSYSSGCTERTSVTTSWNASTDCCEWAGIGCDAATGHVTRLLLSCSRLKGAITSNFSSLFSIRHLESLSLVDNDFRGSPIPPELGRFENLIELSLFGSNFSGNVPLEIAHLAKLEIFRLVAYPTDEKMRIGADTFEAIVRNLTGLKVIFFSNIDMSVVPIVFITNVSSSLTDLGLISCALRGKLPETALHFPKLQALYLDRNDLYGVFPWSSLNLESLLYLDLSENRFTGQLPHNRNSSSKYPGIISPSSLIHFQLSNNSFTGTVPSWIFKLPSLMVLALDNNLFTGELLEFRNTSSLWYLSVGNNNLHGVVPRSILQSPELQLLDLSSNNFTGSFEPGTYPNLRTFLASKNRFEGEISTSFCNLTSLNLLDLSDNNLRGVIPRCMGNFGKNLTVLNLGRNELRGTIPENWKNSMRNLNLNGNRLEGSVPKSLQHCKGLEILDLGNNLLNDTFPNWLDSLPKLKVLILSANRFHGPIGIPKNSFPFPELRIIDLSHNDFVGALPVKYIKNFKAMMNTENVELAYMGDGYYQDSVTVTMKGFSYELVKILNILTTIDFSNNKFTGEVPESIGMLKSLKGLNFSSNMLRGYLPSALGSLRNLEWLDFSCNGLSGEIPNALVDISGLSFLNLSYNKLEGPIPSGKQFETFDNDSYGGNPGLCGFPLSKSCDYDNKEAQLELGDEEGWRENGIVLEWKVVMMGFASGVVIGISIGYMVLFARASNHWFAKRFGKRTSRRRTRRSS